MAALLGRVGNPNLAALSRHQLFSKVQAQPHATSPRCVSDSCLIKTLIVRIGTAPRSRKCKRLIDALTGEVKSA